MYALFIVLNEVDYLDGQGVWDVPGQVNRDVFGQPGAAQYFFLRLNPDQSNFFTKMLRLANPNMVKCYIIKGKY